MVYYGGDSIYDSLQARYEHRFSRNLTFTASYAWQHEIDDLQNTINQGSCGCQNPRDLHANRANGKFDQPQSLVLGYLYGLPGSNLKGVAGELLGGWQAGGIITFQRGVPFTVLESEDTQNDNGTSEGWEYPMLVPGQKLRVPNHGPSLWFNTAAFSPSVLRYGNAPRNPIFGPGTDAFDLSVIRNLRVPFSESQQLQFRAEFFNAFNTPQFAAPDQYLGDVTFGQITSTAMPNREIQLALKYTF